MPSLITTLPQLTPRKPDSHKGDFGRVLLIGGSRDMPGSISLSGMACLRSGAGLVTVATAFPAQPTVAGFEPSYMTAALPADTDGRVALGAIEELRELIAKATVVACGPGLGQSAELTQLVATLYREVALPMVIDADALNAIAARQTAAASESILNDHAGPRILTPHPGEFARLLVASGGRKPPVPDATSPSPSDRLSAATHFATAANITLVLKGHQTVIADRDRQAINRTGNPGMATGGCGDILTGVIAALVAQHLDPFDAAHLGVHLHGLAGDLAAADLGQVSLIASDLLKYLPAAFQQHAKGERGA